MGAGVEAAEPAVVVAAGGLRQQADGQQRPPAPSVPHPGCHCAARPAGGRLTAPGLLGVPLRYCGRSAWPLAARKSQRARRLSSMQPAPACLRHDRNAVLSPLLLWNGPLTVSRRWLST